MSIKAFLAERNIELSLRRYGVDALNFMALGLFGSLIIGLILKSVGTWLGLTWLVETEKVHQAEEKTASVAFRSCGAWRC